MTVKTLNLFAGPGNVQRHLAMLKTPWVGSIERLKMKWKIIKRKYYQTWAGDGKG